VRLRFSELRIGRLFLSVLVLILLSGCREREVVSGLDQREKLSIVSVLLNAGIPVGEKSTTNGRQERYTISVAESDYSAALNLLGQLGLPRKEAQNTKDLLGGESLIPPTPEIVALRVDLVTGERLKQLIQSLPGVIDSEVFYQRPTNAAAAKATVLVRHTAEAGALRDRVESLAQKTLPEIRPEGLEVSLVTVSLKRDGALVDFPSPFSFQVPAAERERATYQVFALLGLSMLAALFVGFFAGLVLSGVLWRRYERRRSDRRRTGEYPVVSLKTSGSLPVQQEEGAAE